MHITTMQKYHSSENIIGFFPPENAEVYQEFQVFTFQHTGHNVYSKDKIAGGNQFCYHFKRMVHYK